MWVSMLKSKSDALTEFKHFKALAEEEQYTHIKCFVPTEVENLPRKPSQISAPCRGSSVSSLRHIRHNRTALWREEIGLLCP